MTEKLPGGHTIALTSSSMQLIERLVEFDMPGILGRCSMSNNPECREATFIYSTDPMDEARYDQRSYKIMAVARQAWAVSEILNTFRTKFPKSAFRIVVITTTGLSHATDYNPLEGKPNNEIATTC